MNTLSNHWIRQLHRWLSITFMLTVIAEPSVWITDSPLFSLALLLLTGLYLFVLSYAAKARAFGPASGSTRQSRLYTLI